MLKIRIVQLICTLVAVSSAAGLSRGAVQEALPQRASEEVLRPLREAFRAFNAGQRDQFRAAWAQNHIYIVDDLPPYIWSGDGAWDRWMSDAAAASTGLSNLSIRALKPLRVDVGETFAYVLLPVEVTYKDHGKSMSQTGTQIDILVRTPVGWKIQAMSYAGQTPVRK